jgi:hypothetical protein
MFLILCAGFGTYFYLTRQIQNYTSDAPIAIPTVTVDDESASELESRLEVFVKATNQVDVVTDDPEDEKQLAASQSDSEDPDAVAEANIRTDEQVDFDSGSPAAKSVPKPTAGEPAVLRLTATDLNTLVTRHPELKDRLFLRIEDGIVSGDFSLPLDDWLPGGQGRFFNGSGSFDVRLQDDVLEVNLVDAKVGDQPLPAALLSEIRKRNLAIEFQKDSRVRRVLKRYESITVQDDRLVLTLKPKRKKLANRKATAEPN